MQYLIAAAEVEWFLVRRVSDPAAGKTTHDGGVADLG
jgi:hypothetical protein